MGHPTAARPAVAALLSAILAVPIGCGDRGGSSSTAEATVRGTVKLGGRPLAGGTITFHPANVRRKDAAPRSSTIGPDGSYSIRTLVGGNGVSVGGPEVRKHPGLEYEEQTRYVGPGGETVDLDLNPPRPPAPRAGR